MSDAVGIVILGGGEATRLPGKLLLAIDDELPMIVRVYRNVRGDVDTRREIFISAKETFQPEIDALLPVPIVIDRWNRRGPLAGMLTTMAQMRSRFVFAVAGDAPFINRAFIDTLSDSEEAGTNVEAIVPVCEREDEMQIEPLAALYDRLAFLREGFPVLRSGRGSLCAVIDRLRTQFVPMGDERTFTNVNTPADFAALSAWLAGEGP